MDDQSRRDTPAPQGDALAVWALWSLLLVAILVTYTRFDPTDLYHVSGTGLSGGASRALVAMNYPIALMAIALVLVAMNTLDSRWWFLAGPTLVCCLATTWPGVVDDQNLDARHVNAIPALGVVAAVGLTLVAASRSGHALNPKQPLDRLRVAVVAAALLLSLPWLAADLGFYLPDGLFITQRPITGSDGAINPAVHLGHHHGFDGALLLISATVLSRVPLRRHRLGRLTTACLSFLGVYGAVNFAEDLLHEQLQKRDVVDWRIPKATEPTLTTIWLVILVASVAVFHLLRTVQYRRSAAHP